MKKILIAGDSFAADWTKKYKDLFGWVNMLENDFIVKNIAQAGTSEYKVLLQLNKENLSNYDYVIVSHTSAYRLPIAEHPIHKNDILHYNCDLIYSDVKEHSYHPIMKIANEFYEHIFNPEYFIFINNLLSNEIMKMNGNMFNITFFDSFYDDRVIKMENIYLKNKGLINHMNENGNELVYKKILKMLK